MWHDCSFSKCLHMSFIMLGLLVNVLGWVRNKHLTEDFSTQRTFISSGQTDNKWEQRYVWLKSCCKCWVLYVFSPSFSHLMIYVLCTIKRMFGYHSSTCILLWLLFWFGWRCESVRGDLFHVFSSQSVVWSLIHFSNACGGVKCMMDRGLVEFKLGECQSW